MINKHFGIYSEYLATALNPGINLKKMILNACFDIMMMAAGLLCAALTTLIIGL